MKILVRALLVTLATQTAAFAAPCATSPNVCTADAMNAAIASASNGDTISIDLGQVTWSTQVIVPATKYLTIQGAGSDATVVKDGVGTPGGSSGPLFTVNAYTGGNTAIDNSDKLTRVTGIDFEGTAAGGGQSGGSIEDGMCWKGTDNRTNGRIRWDNCIVGNFGYAGGSKHILTNTVVGVIDHVTFNNQHFHIWSQAWNGVTHSDASFSEPIVWGNQNWLVFEDCTMNGTAFGSPGGFCDTYNGGRTVFRKCHFNHTEPATHGTESGSGRNRGVVAIDCYQNIFDGAEFGPYIGKGKSNGSVLFMRSGTLRFHDNTINNWANPFINFFNYRMYWNFDDQGIDGADGTCRLDKNDVDDHGWSNPGRYFFGSADTSDATKPRLSVRAVTDPHWADNFWQGYIVRRPDVPTAIHGVPQTFSVITSNTHNQLNYSASFRTPTNDLIFSSGDNFEIRKVIECLDGGGRLGGTLTGEVATPPHFGSSQSAPNDQITVPTYEWANSVAIPFQNGNLNVTLGPDKYAHGTPPPSDNYTTLIYPHPLITGIAAAPTILGPGSTNFTIGTAVDCSIPANCITFTTVGFSAAPTLTKVGGTFPSSNVAFAGATPAPGQARITGTGNSSSPGDYTFTIHAANGGETADKTFKLTLISPNNPPTASIGPPANGQTFLTTDTVTVTGQGADTDGSVIKVEVLDGATVLKTCASPAPSSPCTYSANFTAGSHSFTARATDNSSAVASSSPAIGITVNNPPTTPTPPASIQVKP